MRSIRWWLAGFAACVAVQGHAGEMEVRAKVEAEVRGAFTRGDFRAIEKRYAAALASNERTPSGAAVPDVIRRNLVPDAPGTGPAGRDDHWIGIEKKTEEWTREFPQSSLAAVAQAEAFIAHGFAWRGEGFANTVTPEAFRKFRTYVDRAHEALMARQRTGRKDPSWYFELLRVARLQSWSGARFDALVDESTRAFPLYYPIYIAISANLEPRWGGSPQAIAGLADYAARQSRHVEGESFYARVYIAAESSLKDGVSGPDVDWARVRTGFDDLVKRYPDPRNLNIYARMACEARDMPTVRRVLQRIGEDVQPDVWKTRQAYVRCRQAAGASATS
jgi:hypothetical protein